jgi:hypothetical protein
MMRGSYKSGTGTNIKSSKDQNQAEQFLAESLFLLFEKTEQDNSMHIVSL